MKFMKLGSKLDTFYTAEEVRSVSSEVSRDIVVQVKGCKYLLHKFPLLSKSAYLQRLCSEIPECAPQPHLVQLHEFPGGPEAFELCAKFCYGITITLSASNIVAARCAAEFLQMTEEVETGNMIQKLDVFFNSCVLNRWRDTIVALRSTLKVSTWSEEFGITKKCVEAISAKILANPLKAKLPCKGRSDGSNIGNRTGGSTYKVTENKAWWFEDLSDLCMDLYWRVTISIKSSEKIPPTLIGDALKVYASKWLPSISNRGADKNINLSQLKNSKQILIFYSIISLLPTERSSASCKFLCKLLKAANLLNASSSSKMELTRRIAAQLEEANVSDLLIPNPPNDSNMLIYNVDIVMTILEIVLLQGQSPQRVAESFERRRSKSTDNINFEVQGSSRRRSSSASHSSKLKVAKLVDGYLQEIAKDANLPLSKFLAVAESVPVFARLDHDALYKAIDTYLEAHPDLGKNERKRMCRILDCGKLSMEASAHAAHNEKLPLRVVVQLLFLEHSKIVMSKSHRPADEQKTVLASNGPSTPCHGKEDQWNTTTGGLKSPKPVHPSLREEEMDEEEDETAADGIKNSCMLKNLCVIPARPKKMLSKLWPVNSRVPNERS
ncbi:unnamed protein product [Rhodiola kirilowii]